MNPQIDEAFLARLRKGDHTAAAAVYEQFAARLVALARSRLDPRIRQKVDPEDVVQSVFASFFTRHAGDQFQLDDADGLWALLALITVRKCGHKVEQYRSARRNVDAEMGFGPLGDSSAWEAAASDPSPSQAAMLTETVEAVMQRLEPRQRQVLGLALQGVAHEEIARVLACSLRTVRRALDRTRFVLSETPTSIE
jgi:RNA polymerase sigma-70 factor (ECF subfamily)